jgi:hypothetical protein
LNAIEILNRELNPKRKRTPFKNHYPETITEYQMIYAGDKGGQASGEYYNAINLTFNRIAKKYKMPTRMPPALYCDIVSENRRYYTRDTGNLEFCLLRKNVDGMKRVNRLDAG